MLRKKTIVSVNKHCVKYARIQVFSNPVFPYKLFTYIRETTGQKNPYSKLNEKC